MAKGIKTGGRKKGTPNKATASIRDVARKYTDEAVETLAGIMSDPKEPAAARVSAAQAILDRGYGKPSNVISDEDGNPATFIHEIKLVGVSANR